MKPFPHWEQMKGFIPAWINMWFFRFALLVKVFPHWGQVDCSSKVWICICALRLLFCMKLFPHSEQVKGLFPVWISMWLLRLPLRVKVFPHSEQVKGLFPAWTIITCASRGFVWLWKCFHTQSSWKALFHCEYSCDLKVYFAIECLSTLRAGERLFSRMN